MDEKNGKLENGQNEDTARKNIYKLSEDLWSCAKLYNLSALQVSQCIEKIEADTLNMYRLYNPH